MLIFPDVIRNWFLGLYILALLSVVAMSIYLQVERKNIEKQEGPLPSPGILIPLGIPLFILITRIGEITVGWFYMRWMGLGLSVYFLVILPWFMITLGRFAVPGQALYQDHKLITHGPYSFVRHPLYSAAIALWFGAALGTANWLLMGLFPLLVIIILRFPVRQEETLMNEKFGAAYKKYSENTPRIIPGLW
ncbi:MAG: isoprenylcysteine carboxylmethyltransferase family protein [Cyclobacteriaceae bacterium]|nr:isoprenylcysteine carboxylmethyltransferase family protein [Cyclobacteriaceae bacterium]